MAVATHRRNPTISEMKSTPWNPTLADGGRPVKYINYIIQLVTLDLCSGSRKLLPESTRYLFRIVEMFFNIMIIR
jgi:hypothetical protein